MSEGVKAPRRSSEIIASATELKQKYGKKEKGGKEAKDDDLKADLNMDEHTVDLDELYSRLSTSGEGLSGDEAARRLEVQGENRLTPPKQTPEIVKLIKEMTGFFSLLLWAGAILCFVGYGLKSEVDNLYLGIVLTAVVIITGLFSYFQERKSSQLMESFKNMMPSYTTAVRDGSPTEVNALQLVAGDVVQLKSGNKVPADIRVIACSDDMEVDNSSLTGEAEPQKRLPDCTDENPLETKNLAFFGTEVVKGSCTALVINTGDRTVMGRIARLSTQTEAVQTPIGKEIHHFVAIVSTVAIILGISFFIIGFILGTDWITNLVFMIGIIVANVPEGLLATVTVCLARTANRMATKAVLVKNLEGVETLGSTTCICSDKTGTLTQNMMTVANVVYDSRIWNCESSMHRESDLEEDRESFRRLQRCATLCNNAVWDKSSQFRKAANGRPDPSRPVPYAGQVTLGDGSVEKRVFWKSLGDASESALIKFCQFRRDILEFRGEYAKLKEIPFNSSNKFQVSVHRQPARDDGSPAGDLLVMKGAPERIISRCSRYWHEGEIREFDDEARGRVEELQVEMSRRGLRVLGFCELELDPEEYPEDYVYNSDNPNFPLGDSWRNPDAVLSSDRTPKPHPAVTTPLVFIGLMAMIDPPRPQVRDAVAKCKTAGIRVIMVTGDHPITAKAIAQKVGIIWSPNKDDVVLYNREHGYDAPDAQGRGGHPEWRDPDLAASIVVPGWDISMDTPEQVWDDILDHNEVVFARTSPQQKLIIVENCQRRGEIVAVTGDGVNDAPALRKADIGVAMGIMGSDVSKEAADMILLDDNFASIVAGVEEGRLIFDNLKKSIAYTLSSNIPEIAPFLCFITVGLPLPLSTVLILCVDLGTDMVPAISMAWENAESDIMRRPPRDSAVDRLVTTKLVSFAYLQIGVIQALSGFFTWFVVMNDYGYPPHILPTAGQYDNWGNQVLYCKLDATNQGVFRNLAGVANPTTGATAQASIAAGYLFWDPNGDGELDKCAFAARNFLDDDASEHSDVSVTQTSSTFGEYSAGLEQPTYQSMQVLLDAGYFEYIPWRARQSPFWDNMWLSAGVGNSDSTVNGLKDKSMDSLLFFRYQTPGYWNITDTSAFKSGDARVQSGVSDLYDATVYKDNLFTQAVYVLPSSAVSGTDDVVVNVASRMCQQEALAHAQCAYFVCIVVVQWADLVICKTRMNSIHTQGMRNPAMNFGLIFETLLAATLCYATFLNAPLGTRNLRLLHWAPGVPFSIVIFLYDEVRKYFMRRTTRVTEDAKTGQVYRDAGWLERFTYY